MPLHREHEVFPGNPVPPPRHPSDKFLFSGCARMTWDDMEGVIMNQNQLRIKGLDGSANGNRTGERPFHLSPVRSNWLILRAGRWPNSHSNTGWLAVV